VRDVAGGYCLWCGEGFAPRRGGSPRRFCCPRHRSAFHGAARRWAEKAVADGMLSVSDLRNGDPAAFTLGTGTMREPAAPEDQRGPQTPQGRVSDDVDRMLAAALERR
jgi:hypothetical protein